MTLATFIAAMPKVDVGLHLEGTLQRQTLLNIASRNEIAEGMKHFQDWVKLYDTPDYKKPLDATKMYSSWLRAPEDLSRIVYDLGVMLAKQNMRYAEIGVTLNLYDALGLNAEEFFSALDDGRERARRAWNIELAFILTATRDDARRADDVARYASSPSGKKGGVVGIGLDGKEMPISEQLERAFRTAEKRSLPRTVRAASADSTLQSIEQIAPNRIQDAWGVLNTPDALAALDENKIPLVIGLSSAYRNGWTANAGAYPLRALYDAGVTFSLTADMPSLYKTTLNDEYQKAVDSNLLTVDELCEVALNAVRVSFMEDEAKAAMVAQYEQEYATLREEHLAGEKA